MKTSEQIDQISEALATAQGEIKNPEKSKTAKIPMKAGGSYSYNYADLPSMIDCVRQAMAKNGLSHFASLENLDNYLSLSMRIAHKSGQWIESSVPIFKWSDEKHLASQVTYYRRYLFQSLIGIAGDDDLDGEPEIGGEYISRKPIASQDRPQVIVAKPKVLSPGNRDYAVEAGWTDALPTCMDAVIPFGKQKGQPLMGVSVDEAKKMAEWVIDTANKEGKPVSKSWGKFCAAVQDYVLNSAPALTETDVPMFDMNSPTSIHQ